MREGGKEGIEEFGNRESGIGNREYRVAGDWIGNRVQRFLLLNF